jgi:hypothetical protein
LVAARASPRSRRLRMKMRLRQGGKCVG